MEINKVLNVIFVGPYTCGPKLGSHELVAEGGTNTSLKISVFLNGCTNISFKKKKTKLHLS